MRGWILPAVLAAGVLSAACDRGGSPVQVIGGGSSLTITVGSGTTPSYSWSGGRARSLTVQSPSGELFWQVEALSFQEGFASPAQHGVTPVGARAVTAARALQPGVVHTATIVGVDGTQGLRTFTPTSITAP
jgi:hypothetical protein